MTRARPALTLVLAVTLLLAGCADDDGFFSSTTDTTSTTAASTTTVEETTTTVTTTAPGETTTTAETTSTTSAPTTTDTTAPAAGCSGPGAGPIPTDNPDIFLGGTDLDGDDVTDLFATYPEAGAWHLHIELATGYTTRLVLDDAWAAIYGPPGVNYVQPVALPTLGSPEPVVMVSLYRGMVTTYALFAFEDCQIVPLVGDDGMLPDLWAGTGPAHSDWPVCGPGPAVSQVVFSSPEGCGELSTCGTPNLNITEYQVRRHPAGLHYVGESSRASTQAEMDDLRDQRCVPF